MHQRPRMFPGCRRSSAFADAPGPGYILTMRRRLAVGFLLAGLTGSPAAAGSSILLVLARAHGVGSVQIGTGTDRLHGRIWVYGVLAQAPPTVGRRSPAAGRKPARAHRGSLSGSSSHSSPTVDRKSGAALGRALARSPSRYAGEDSLPWPYAATSHRPDETRNACASVRECPPSRDRSVPGRARGL